MHKVHVFMHLNWRERLLVVEALAIVVMVRLGLKLLPFQKLRALVNKAGQHRVGSRNSAAAPIDRVAWTVRAVSEFVPGATCLTQALSGQVLLARRGYPTCLHIGVAKERQDELAAHAWLECDGRIVLGDHGFLAVYAPFPSLE